MKKIIVFVFFIIFLVGCSDLFEPRYFKSIGNEGVITYPDNKPAPEIETTFKISPNKIKEKPFKYKKTERNI